MLSRIGQMLNKLWTAWHLDLIGVVVGAVFFMLSLTPSLLPRTALYQGVSAGLSAATGYAVGVFAHWVWLKGIKPLLREPLAHAQKSIGQWFNKLTGHDSLPRSWRSAIDIGTYFVVFVALVIFAFYASRWQGSVAELIGERSYTPVQFVIIVIPVALIVWIILLLIARGIRGVCNFIIDHGPGNDRAHKSRVFVTWVAVILIVFFGVQTFVPDLIINGAEHIFSVKNDEYDPDFPRPEQSERSGSPDSLATWDGLGNFGAQFVSAGFHAQQLEDLLGKPAREPIRVYAGLANADTDQSRADLIVEEFKRTNAQDREAIMLVPTTGRGWVNQASAQALELLHNGNTAIAGMQYSYLPSGVQFIADQERPREAGRILISTVLDWVDTLPENDRPKVYLYGESLGSAAGEAAFSGLRDITTSTDGVLWMGPPNSNEIWSSLVERRDPESREVSPVYADGMVVRFTQSEEQLWSWKDIEFWQQPRVLYFQHASDPVVWFSPDLIFQRPDWLREAPGEDRTGSMRWMPFVTFWQVTMDLPNAVDVPPGHGHNYGLQGLDGLAAVTAPGMHTQQELEQMHQILYENYTLKDIR